MGSGAAVLARVAPSRSPSASPQALQARGEVVAAMTGDGGQRHPALLGFVYLGAMQKLLGHQPLTPVQWVPVLAAPMLLPRPRRPARRSPAVANGRWLGRSARNRRATRP